MSDEDRSTAHSFLLTQSAGVRSPSDWAHHKVPQRRAVARAYAAVYAGIGVGAIVLAFALPIERPIERTRLLERLADRAERAPPLPLETARELAVLTSSPQSDCDQLGCTPEIAARNARARQRLQVLVAAAMRRSPEVAADALSLPPVLPVSAQR
jgi:hypothetical protein